MITFNKPENLNGKELRDELNASGIKISYDVDALMVNGENKLLLNIDVKDEAKAEAIVAAHNGTIVAPEPSVADKLASVGLNLDDLKAALGI